MAEFDPLVANGITYAPIKDIVMSDAPIYGAEPYRGNPMIAGSQAAVSPTLSPAPSKPDEFVPQNKKSSSWWKWALGITGTIVGIFGLKKGVKGIRNSVKCQNFFTSHPKFKSFLSSIKNHIPFVKKW